jgi:hypothetical protein
VARLALGPSSSCEDDEPGAGPACSQPTLDGEAKSYPWPRWLPAALLPMAAGRLSVHDVDDIGNEVFWHGFLTALMQRALGGVRLVISDSTRLGERFAAPCFERQVADLVDLADVCIGRPMPTLRLWRSLHRGVRSGPIGAAVPAVGATPFSSARTASSNAVSNVRPGSASS